MLEGSRWGKLGGAKTGGKNLDELPVGTPRNTREALRVRTGVRAGAPGGGGAGGAQRAAAKIGRKPKFDWEHILERHHPTGRIAQQRLAAGGAQAEGVFHGVSRAGLKGIVKNAWKSRKLMETQVAADGSRTLIFRGVDSVSGQAVKFWQHADGTTLAGKWIGK